jgi:hypothetical protein
MYLFSVSGTKPNGLDDEYVIMDNNQKSCVNAYQRLFPGENEYIWKSIITDDFISFKVKGFSEFYNDITVYIEIIDYRYDNISKKMIDKYTMNVFKHRMKIPLNFDFSVCSINNFDIKITNESKFLLPEKRNKYNPEFKIYTGLRGFDTLKESSYLFNDDRDDDIMSYTRLLGTNKFR